MQAAETIPHQKVRKSFLRNARLAQYRVIVQQHSDSLMSPEASHTTGSTPRKNVNPPATSPAKFAPDLPKELLF
jgi:hypothetical protein